MCDKFEWKYLKTSELILSLYDKTIQHVSSCPNSNIMSIKAQLNNTYITVFTISIYVTLVKFYGLDNEGFNMLAGVRNFSRPQNIQMCSSSTQPPTGAPSSGVM
jgi:hypothetical protein